MMSAMTGKDCAAGHFHDNGHGIWVFAEQRGGQLLEVSLEMLGEARRLAERLDTEVAAVLLGEGISAEARALIVYGADIVYVADDPRLAHFNPDFYSVVMTDLILAQRPQILLLGGTNLGRDLAPTVAVRLGTGLCADCTALDLDDEGRLLQIAPVLGGRELATMLCPVRRPQMATVRPGVFNKRAPEERPGRVVNVVPGSLGAPRVVVRETVSEKQPGRSLERADVVVGGGAGVDGEEGWRLLRQLAALLGAEVGGTRPPMDEGYIPEDRMIGQSGVTIRPKLYFAIGISGDIQHTVGLRDAGVIVAINNDPTAPIFRAADYGIVGDYREVVARLIGELSEGKSPSIG